jgi:hypothetical protein
VGVRGRITELLCLWTLIEASYIKSTHPFI